MAAATTTPIASLEPGLDADSTSVTGIVTLIWPYASSSQTLSLLLVEPDFRLRRNQGQVRIHFTGASAKAVARAHVASGDQLLLNLKGVKWAKDGSTASTPGKGIEWDLRYGERVVLQIQRDDQQPILLDIDHPTPSPEPFAQTPTPRLSPPYDSHIPSTVQKRQLDTQAWASPAFLMRCSHFAASAYDPFAEEDLPDYDRRKRSKFGRGSGQWRFADRTPSPEKEPETTTFDIGSPSKLPAQHRKPKKEVTLPIETIQKSRAQDVDGSGNEARVLHTEDNEEAASFGPLSPPSTHVEPTKIEFLEEVKRAAQAPPSLSVQSVISSSSPSNSGQEFDLQDDGGSQMESVDAATFSGPASDFGLDGSVFSRTSKAKVPPEEEVEKPRKRVEVEEEDEGSQASAREVSPPKDGKAAETDEELEEQQLTIPESAHEFLPPGGDDSRPMSTVHDHLQAAQLRSSPVVPSYDQLESEQAQEIESISSEEMSDEKELRKYIVDKSPVEEEEATVSHEEDEEQERPTELESVPAKITLNQEAQAKPLTADSGEKREKEAAEDGTQAFRRSQADLEQAQHIPHEAQQPEDRQSETKRSAVQIINLESDDEESVEQLGSHRTDRSIHGPARSTIVTSGKAMEAMIQKEVSVEETPIDERPESQEGFSIGEPKKHVTQSITYTEETVVVHDTSQKPQETESRATKDTLAEQLPAAEVPPKATILDELPSTVPDSFVDRSSKSQLMTPDATQRTSFASQPSFTSLQSEQDDETLPTPRMSQRNSVGVVPPMLQPSQVVEVKESSPVREETLTIRKTRSSRRKAKEETLVLEKEVSTPQKPPTFIEKLKAMRKLSAQSPRRVSDSSATSPWFVPKRLSQIVPDSEAESEAESSSESDRNAANQGPISTTQTLQKQKPLAASFKRSPQRSAIASIQSSPGYLPPSQPLPPGFRTNISYYVPLATLTSHFGTTVDVLSIALSSTSVTRATTGPKDYNQTIYVTDPAACRQMPNTPIITVQIFRPNNRCFPLIEKGDAILLRDFKVQTFQRNAILLSTQSSAWAVFRRSAPMDVQIRGPPVELGPEERLFAQGLWRWRDNSTLVEKNMLDEKIPKEPPMHQAGTSNKAKKPPKKPAPKPKQMNNTNGTDARIEKEGIEALGVDLQGSQGSQNRTRKAPMRERSLEMDGVMESTEPPKRVLRPRGARGMPESSESPTKATMRRSGTVFTGGLGEPDG